MTPLGELKLPRRVKRIIAACRQGEVLMATIITRDPRIGNEVRFHLHPSGKSVPEISSRDAIGSGELVPQMDGLFGASQTWKAAQ